MRGAHSAGTKRAALPERRTEEAPQMARHSIPTPMSPTASLPELRERHRAMAEALDRCGGRALPCPSAGTARPIGASTSCFCGRRPRAAAIAPARWIDLSAGAGAGRAGPPRARNPPPSSNTARWRRATEDGEDRRTIPYLRAYRVFNAEQIDRAGGRFRQHRRGAARPWHRGRPGARCGVCRDRGADRDEPGARAPITTARATVSTWPPIATFHARGGYYGHAGP